MKKESSAQGVQPSKERKKKKRKKKWKKKRKKKRREKEEKKKEGKGKEFLQFLVFSFYFPILSFLFIIKIIIRLLLSLVLVPFSLFCLSQVRKKGTK